MKFKRGIIIGAVSALAVCLVMAGRLSQAQEPAWKRIQDRLDAGKAPSASEATDLANEARELSEDRQAKIEAEARANMEGVPPPGTADEAAAEEEESDEGSQDPDLPEVAGMDFGSEAEDAGAKDLYQTILEMIPKGGFVYQSTGIPDPMVFPQIRNDAIFTDLWAKHEQILAEAGLKNIKELGKIKNEDELDKAKIAEAIEIVSKITNMRDIRYTPQATERIEVLNGILTGVKFRTGPTTDTAVLAVPCELPKEIKSELKFIIASGGAAGASYALIGDYMVLEGEAVPEYPNVKIVKIEPGKVTFEITGECPTAVTETVVIAPNEDGFFAKGAGERSLLGKGKKGGR